MSILVTGASGFIGSALCASLRASGAVVHAWHRGSPLDQLPLGITTVYHLAAQTSTYAAQAEPLSDLDSNITGFVQLLEALRAHHQTPFVVLASTATIAGVNPILPITGAAPNDPTTFYDVSKRCAELYLRQYTREGWVRGCALRFTNVYGPCSQQQEADRGIVNKLVAKAKRGEPLICYGSGDYLRDYLYIDDAVTALRAAAGFPTRTNGHIFYLGTGKSVRVREVFELVKQLVNPAVQIRYVEAPRTLYPIEFRQVVVNPSAFEEATYWRADWTIADGIREMAARCLAG